MNFEINAEIPVENNTYKITKIDNEPYEVQLINSSDSSVVVPQTISYTFDTDPVSFSVSSIDLTNFENKTLDLTNLSTCPVIINSSSCTILFTNTIDGFFDNSIDYNTVTCQFTLNNNTYKITGSGWSNLIDSTNSSPIVIPETITIGSNSPLVCNISFDLTNFEGKTLDLTSFMSPPGFDPVYPCTILVVGTSELFDMGYDYSILTIQFIENNNTYQIIDDNFVSLIDSNDNNVTVPSILDIGKTIISIDLTNFEGKTIDCTSITTTAPLLENPVSCKILIGVYASGWLSQSIDYSLLDIQIYFNDYYKIINQTSLTLVNSNNQTCYLMPEIQLPDITLPLLSIDFTNLDNKYVDLSQLPSMPTLLNTQDKTLTIALPTYLNSSTSINLSSLSYSTITLICNQISEVPIFTNTSNCTIVFAFYQDAWYTLYTNYINNNLPGEMGLSNVTFKLSIGYLYYNIDGTNITLDSVDQFNISVLCPVTQPTFYVGTENEISLTFSEFDLSKVSGKTLLFYSTMLNVPTFINTNTTCSIGFPPNINWYNFYLSGTLSNTSFFLYDLSFNNDGVSEKSYEFLTPTTLSLYNHSSYIMGIPTSYTIDNVILTVTTIDLQNFSGRYMDFSEFNTPINLINNNPSTNYNIYFSSDINAISWYEIIPNNSNINFYLKYDTNDIRKIHYINDVYFTELPIQENKINISVVNASASSVTIPTYINLTINWITADRYITTIDLANFTNKTLDCTAFTTAPTFLNTSNCTITFSTTADGWFETGLNYYQVNLQVIMENNNYKICDPSGNLSLYDSSISELSVPTVINIGSSGGESHSITSIDLTNFSNKTLDCTGFSSAPILLNSSNCIINFNGSGTGWFDTNIDFNTVKVRTTLSDIIYEIHTSNSVSIYSYIGSSPSISISNSIQISDNQRSIDNIKPNVFSNNLIIDMTLFNTAPNFENSSCVGDSVIYFSSSASGWFTTNLDITNTKLYTYVDDLTYKIKTNDSTTTIYKKGHPITITVPGTVSIVSYNKTNSTLTIPETTYICNNDRNIIGIETNVFNSNAYLTTINILANLDYIGDYAFANLSNPLTFNIQSTKIPTYGTDVFLNTTILNISQNISDPNTQINLTNNASNISINFPASFTFTLPQGNTTLEINISDITDINTTNTIKNNFITANPSYSSLTNIIGYQLAPGGATFSNYISFTFSKPNIPEGKELKVWIQSGSNPMELLGDISGPDAYYEFNGDNIILHTKHFSYIGTFLNPTTPPSPPPLPCLTEDCHVLTPSGYVTIDKLKVGDYVLTSDNKPSKISHILNRTVLANYNNSPYVIPQNYFSENIPNKDTHISKHHLIYVGNNKWLHPGDSKKFKQDKSKKSITYYNLKLENYVTDNLVINGGLIVESYGMETKYTNTYLNRKKSLLIRNS